MQNFRPFPPCVLQDMPGNPKFDPFHWVKIAPKLEKSTHCGHKLISSEGGPDTSACKISCHFLHAFSGKCPETPNSTHFTKSKLEKSSDRGHKLISSEGGQEKSACKISGHFLHAFSGKCPETQILPVSLSQNSSKIRKINRPWP